MTLALELVAGLVLLLLGGELLVRGAAEIATRIGLSKLIVGMVIAGFGTSLPELFVSVRAVVAGVPGLAAGNVLGSNIANILLVLPIAALIMPIEATRRRLEPEGVVLVSISIGVVLLCLQPVIPRWQGAGMIALLLTLLVLRLYQERSAQRRVPAGEAAVETVAPIPVRRWPSVVLILIGLAALPAGGELFVGAATELAQAFGVSEGLIGLTVVAVGTSLPELATTIVAAVRGEQTIGYGNIVGSNIFNLLGIFGAATVAGTMSVPAIMVYSDGVFMIAATIVMLVFLATHARLTRMEAGAMLFGYVAYVAARYTFALS